MQPQTTTTDHEHDDLIQRIHDAMATSTRRPLRTSACAPDHDDIIQIIPATGWHARYEHDEGEEITPLIALGLTRGGDVVGLDTDSSGSIEACKEVSNFAGYVFRPNDTHDAAKVGSVVEAIVRVLQKSVNWVRRFTIQPSRSRVK